MKLTNKSEGGLALVNVTINPLYIAPKSSVVFPNSQLVKGYQKITSLFSDILEQDLSIEFENEKVQEKVAEKVEQPKEELKDEVVEEKLADTTEDEKVTKPKKVTKKEK